MITAKLYAPTGEEKGTIELPEEVFGTAIHRHAMWEVVRNHLLNLRQGTVMTKGRKSVSGGGKKPWAQKKTGRARSGTSRSPVWVGGGRAHGPRPRDWRLGVPKKVRRVALRSALTLKAREEQIAVLSNLPIEDAKTREVYSVLRNLGLDSVKTLLIIPEYDERVLRASRNIPKLSTAVCSELHTYQVMKSDRIVLLEGAVGRMKDGEVTS